VNAQFPRLTPINKWLIIVSVALFFIEASLKQFAHFSLLPYMGLSLSGVSSGLIFEPFTYVFFSHGLMDVIFHALGLWFVGSELEELWGRKRYVSFLVGVSLGGALLYLLMGALFFEGMLWRFPLAGMSGPVMALFLGYAILYPNRPFLFMFVFSVPAKYFCMILIAMSLYTGVFTPAGIGAWGHLGCMAMGVVMMKLMSDPRTKGWFSQSSGRRSASRRSHLKIVPTEKKGRDDNDKTPPPKYFQ